MLGHAYVNNVEKVRTKMVRSPFYLTHLAVMVTFFVLAGCEKSSESWGLTESSLSNIDVDQVTDTVQPVRRSETKMISHAGSSTDPATSHVSPQIEFLSDNERHNSDDVKIEFFLTDTAKNEIQDEFAQNPDKTHLFVSVKPGGCTGFIYLLSLQSISEDASEYVMLVSNDIPIAIPKKTAIYLNRTTLDFKTTDSGESGFRFDNPNVVKSCDPENDQPKPASEDKQE